MQTKQAAISSTPNYSQIEHYVKALMDQRHLGAGGNGINNTERSVAIGLQKKGIGALYEPGIFVRGGGPDFLTRLYYESKMVSIEIHPVWWQLAHSKITLHQTAMDFHKYARRKRDHPELHHIVISDLRPETLSSIFRIEIKAFSDEYWHIQHSKRSKIVRTIENLVEDSKSKIKEDYKDWRRDIIKVIEIEHKALQRKDF
ncbi:MAG TPA: hypothetical protein VNF06_01130 [Candidatus Aquilonibacter sp.]|nr:hypothetical protein [Candidatus Aquilonibacter sp.]